MDNLKVHIYSILDLPIIEEHIKNYDGKSSGLKMSINNNNITRIFETFITSNISKQKLDENEQVALFASIIFGECNDIKGKPNHIVTPLSKKKVSPGCTLTSIIPNNCLGKEKTLWWSPQPPREKPFATICQYWTASSSSHRHGRSISSRPKRWLKTRGQNWTQRSSS